VAGLVLLSDSTAVLLSCRPAVLSLAALPYCSTCMMLADAAAHSVTAGCPAGAASQAERWKFERVGLVVDLRALGCLLDEWK
jgi:hypothetical protein